MAESRRAPFKENVTHDTSVRGCVAIAAAYSGFLCGIVALTGVAEYWYPIALIAGVVGALALNPPRDLWIEGDALVSKEPLRRAKRMRFDEIDWINFVFIPHAGNRLTIRSSAGWDIEIASVDESSSQLRRAIGKHVSARHKYGEGVVDLFFN